MKSKLFLILASIMMVAFSANAETYIEFSGNVGKSGVRGGINLYSYGYGNAKSGTALGNYSYKNHSGSLTLKGSWKALSGDDAKITLTEVDNKGRESATWTLTYDAYNMVFTGTMKTRKGKTYKVKLYSY